MVRPPLAKRKYLHRSRVGASTLSIRPVIQEAQQAFQSGVGVFVDMLGHLIIHKWVVLVADHTPAIGYLGDVAGAVATIGTPSMPDLIVELGTELLLC